MILACGGGNGVADKIVLKAPTSKITYNSERSGLIGIFGDKIRDTELSIKTPIRVAELSRGSNPTKDRDLDMIARVVNAEANNQPYDGKVALASVILFRSSVDNQGVEEVLTRPGQFDAIKSSRYLEQPSSECMNAAMDAMDGKSKIKGAYHYVNLKLAQPNWARPDKFIGRIGDHWFYAK